MHAMCRDTRGAYYIPFRTIPGTSCNSRAYEVYKTKEDDVMLWPLLFRNAYKLSPMYVLIVMKGVRRYVQVVVSCLFLRAMGLKY